MEHDLVPYQACARIPAARALVLAPHPDDETFGCGGAIAAHAAHGDALRIVVLTDGGVNGDVLQRENECRAACAALGAPEPQFWRLPDRRLLADPALVARIVEAVRQHGAELLYAPSPWEVHPDHRQAATAAIGAALETGTRIAFYEIGAPLRPNLLLDLTPQLERVRRASAAFVSQQAKQDYTGHLEALHRYRTYTLGANVEAAEAYLVLDAPQLRETLPALLQALPVTATAQLPLADTPQPRVTLLIRSIDRATLASTLDSVAVQTWPNLEVVVVAAQPGHRPLPERCGPFPLRLVTTDTPLARSGTANRALDHAQGELLLFLDDDDWLLPSHVARLAQALQGNPHVLVAYTGVALADDAGRPIGGQVMDLPYDGVRQMAGNLTPIHAVMFRRELVARGCRFDEALDRYEDWDFWLQASRHSVFAHVPGVSALYRIHHSSGVHADSGAASGLIYDKWRAEWDAGRGVALMQRAWATEDAEQRRAQLVAMRERELASRDAEIEHRGREIARRDAELLALQQQLGAREHELAQRNGDLAWRADLLARREADAALQQHEIARRDLEIAARVADIAVRDAEITRRDIEIGGLKHEMSRLAGDVAWRDGEIARRDEALGRCDAEIVALRAALADHEARAAEHAQQAAQQAAALAGRDAEVQALRASTSWRMTAPFRRLTALFRSRP